MKLLLNSMAPYAFGGINMRLLYYLGLFLIVVVSGYFRHDIDIYDTYIVTFAYMLLCYTYAFHTNGDAKEWRKHVALSTLKAKQRVEREKLMRSCLKSSHKLIELNKRHLEELKLCLLTLK